VETVFHAFHSSSFPTLTVPSSNGGEGDQLTAKAFMRSNHSIGE
jgi:hypothetical protein